MCRGTPVEKHCLKTMGWHSKAEAANFKVPRMGNNFFENLFQKNSYTLKMCKSLSDLQHDGRTTHKLFKVTLSQAWI